MFTTFKDLVQATRDKFTGATNLSRDMENGTAAFTTCAYGHQVNGIGCAIGCHFPHDIAHDWDQENAPISDMVMNSRYGYDRVQLAKVFDLNRISADELQRLQCAHDRSANVAEFLARCDNYLATGNPNRLCVLNEYEEENLATINENATP